MDEKMQNILEDVRKTAAAIGDAATDAAYGVGVKAKEMLSAGKLNIRLAELNNARQAALQQVGEMVYGTHTGSPTDSEVLLEKLQEIDALSAEITALQAELSRARGERVCAGCGAAAKKGDIFCRDCGRAL